MSHHLRTPHDGEEWAWLLRAAAVVVLAAGLGAGVRWLEISAMPAPSPIVDTWPVGNPVACEALARSCADASTTALAELDRRDPGHAAVVSSQLRQQGTCRDPRSGDVILFQSSGGPTWVLLVKESDGSTHAIGVGWPGISRTPVAYDRDSSSGQCDQSGGTIRLP